MLFKDWFVDFFPKTWPNSTRVHVRAYAASSRNFLLYQSLSVCRALFNFAGKEDELQRITWNWWVIDVIFFQFVTLQMHLSRRIFTGLPVRPSHKMDFRSSAAKSGHPGEGKHEGLVPRNDVLTNGFIWFSLARSLARILFVPRLRSPWKTSRIVPNLTLTVIFWCEAILWTACRFVCTLYWCQH